MSDFDICARCKHERREHSEQPDEGRGVPPLGGGPSMCAACYLEASYGDWDHSFVEQRG